LTRDLFSPKAERESSRAPRHKRALFICQRADARLARVCPVQGRTVNVALFAMACQ